MKVALFFLVLASLATARCTRSTVANEDVPEPEPKAEPSAPGAPCSPYVEPPPEPCKCSMFVWPVCGEDNRSYLNSGCAECAGAKVACLHACPCSPYECPMESKLVCGTNGRTYHNDCIAYKAGTEVACWGHCPCSPCGCPSYTFDPVCGTDGKPYGNECLAKCAGVDVKCHGICRGTSLNPSYKVEVEVFL